MIGTYAGPRDPGTALVHAMHAMGTIEGVGGAWGYVEGGMGRISVALADAARAAGALVVTGVEVGAVVPGEGVRLEGGELVRAATVVSNADPKRTVALCGDDVPDHYRRRVQEWRTDSPVVKVNCGLTHLPRFTAAGPADRPHRAMVTVSTGVDATPGGLQGQPAGRALTGVVRALLPHCIRRQRRPGRASHHERVRPVRTRLSGHRRLGQPSPRDRRPRAGGGEPLRTDVADVVEHRQVLGPLDVEARVGLTGGHIFQGECLPDQMWDRRLATRTPMPGVYLCGAATHPGGGVSAINGRNAAMAVLADRRRRGKD
ncbi:MAG: NAD(P)/FAD-dependent oxidoreductase [Acidimicrobiia bacterium]|nr:NAD(P)/FAD-dependent oxidoreductase [Acidimicrobiia bacterium]